MNRLETAPTEFVENAGINSAYRKLGTLIGIPVVLLQAGDLVETADDSAVEVVGSAWDRHTWRRELDPP